MDSTGSDRHQVVLVREWDRQMGDSGCCGRLSSDVVGELTGSCTTTGEDPYAHVRADMARMGAVYRALRERFGDDEIEIVVTDPRNTAWLVPAIWRAARRRGLPVRDAVRQVNAATAACTVTCDGVVVATDPEPAEAVAAVVTDLASRR
ncbi:hypothetical protein [Pseudonocardia nigra]|uniref:hypothetical protein n=1 Tax=Pseudonocardia nigra TaxID=1921578 RepID=UPI001C5E4291|nr:hypothetical protein [Pseudonocardia nigra]